MQSHKALILDGAHAGDDAFEQVRGIIVSRLIDAGWEATELILRTMTFNGCAACPEGDCGELDNCITRDDGGRIRGAFRISELAVILTPLRSGVYSYSIKNAFDRLTSLYSSSVRREGERYRLVKPDVSYPSLFAVGVADEPDESRERLFQNVVERTAHGFLAPAYRTLMLYRYDPLETWDRTITDSLRVLYSRITG